MLITGRPIQGSCGRRKADLLPGEEPDIECLCEATGNDSACSGISEDELVQAMLRVKEGSKDISKVSEELERKLS